MRRYFAHVQLLLQNDHSSHKTRQRMDPHLDRPWKAANLELHISWVLERRVFHLLLPNLLASNCQREEVLAVLLPVADLDPRPLSNIGNRVAKYNIPGTGLVVIIAEMPSQDNLWRTDTYMNSCIAPNVNKKGNKNLPWGFQFEMLLWV